MEKFCVVCPFHDVCAPKEYTPSISVSISNSVNSPICSSPSDVHHSVSATYDNNNAPINLSNSVSSIYNGCSVSESYAYGSSSLPSDCPLCELFPRNVIYDYASHVTSRRQNAARIQRTENQEMSLLYVAVSNGGTVIATDSRRAVDNGKYADDQQKIFQLADTGLAIGITGWTGSADNCDDHALAKIIASLTARTRREVAFELCSKLAVANEYARSEACVVECMPTNEYSTHDEKTWKAYANLSIISGQPACGHMLWSVSDKRLKSGERICFGLPQAVEAAMSCSHDNDTSLEELASQTETMAYAIIALNTLTTDTNHPVGGTIQVCKMPPGKRRENMTGIRCVGYS